MNSVHSRMGIWQLENKWDVQIKVCTSCSSEAEEMTNERKVSNECKQTQQAPKHHRWLLNCTNPPINVFMSEYKNTSGCVLQITGCIVPAQHKLLPPERTDLGGLAPGCGLLVYRAGVAPRSGGKQFYPGPSLATPATRALSRLQRERGEAPCQSTQRQRPQGQVSGERCSQVRGNYRVRWDSSWGLDFIQLNKQMK